MLDEATFRHIVAWEKSRAAHHLIVAQDHVSTLSSVGMETLAEQQELWEWRSYLAALDSMVE